MQKKGHKIYNLGYQAPDDITCNKWLSNKIRLAIACGVPAVGVQAVNCWQ